MQACHTRITRNETTQGGQTNLRQLRVESDFTNVAFKSVIQI